MVLQIALVPRQTQSVVMTPQLQQAIKLLQMSGVDVGTFVAQALEQNSFLERDTGIGDELPSAVEVGDQAAGGGDDAVTASFEHVVAHDGAPPFRTGARAVQEAGRSLDETLAVPAASLRDHLSAQLDLDCPAPVDRMMGRAFIDALDDNGWLVADPNDMARHLGIEQDRATVLLERMRGYEPAGVFARSLSDCLALQLAEKHRLDPMMRTFLNHLDLVAKRDVGALMKVCGGNAEDIEDMIADVRALEPRPARCFDQATISQVIPDVVARRLGYGWTVELNPDAFPRILVESGYYFRIHNALKNKEEKSFLAAQLRSAHWLVRVLSQRATTILGVASEIVRRQCGFLDHGVAQLRPLVLRDVAQTLDMHESTVSRATSNKYVSTPRGVFELKYFFTQAINATNGSQPYSSESIRHRIKALVDAETPQRILSDDALMRQLKADGVDIARRTIAKYREGMRIPSSTQRKRDKCRTTVTRSLSP